MNSWVLMALALVVTGCLAAAAALSGLWAMMIGIIGLGLMLLTRLLQDQRHQRDIEKLTQAVNARVGSVELSPLTECSAELRPLCHAIDALFTTAAQRISVSSSIVSAVQTRAEESNRDKLTGLYNRGYLNSHLDDEVGRTKALSDELSLIMVDVDHFKHYNDTNGHQAGDEVLKTVANLLTKTTRALDVCIRYGGEEFTVLLPRTSHERGKRTAERIKENLIAHDFPNGEKQPGGRVTASFGVASLPRHAATGEELIRRADQALYAAKQAGRNRVASADDVPTPSKS